MTGPERPRADLRGPEIVGVILIALGVLFLLGQFGWIVFGWATLWPLLLVGVGVLILVGGLGSGGTGGESVAHVPREGSDQLELDLRLGAGRFALRGGSSDLVEAASKASDIDLTVRREGRRARIRLGLARPWFPFSERGTPDWRISVGTDVPTRLDMAAGAGDFDLDLSEIRLVDARLSVGAAQARVTLPHPVGEVPIRISTGASQVTIAVPAGVHAQVRTSGGLFDISGPVESLGYATAVDRVAVRVEGGAASIRVV